MRVGGRRTADGITSREWHRHTGDAIGSVGSQGLALPGAIRRIGNWWSLDVTFCQTISTPPSKPLSTTQILSPSSTSHCYLDIHAIFRFIATYQTARICYDRPSRRRLAAAPGRRSAPVGNLTSHHSIITRPKVPFLYSTSLNSAPTFSAADQLSGFSGLHLFPPRISSPSWQTPSSPSG